jgi:hypothetical protein
MPNATAAPNAAALRGRKQIQSLLEELHAARAEYAAWELTAAKLRKLANDEVRPLALQFSVHTRQLILVFDQGYGHAALHEAERAVIAETICLLADGFLRTNDDPEIKLLYNRYSGGDYDGERAKHKADLRKMIEGENSKPTAAERNAQQLAAQKQVSVLRGKLLPMIDSLPSEQQSALREQADAAYVNSDTLSLQVLEIELEQRGGIGGDTLGSGRIRRYKQILQDYLDDLEFDTVAIQFSLIMHLGLPGMEPLTQHSGRQHLLRQKSIFEDQLGNIACDVVDLRDVSKLKAWVKQRQTLSHVN